MKIEDQNKKKSELKKEPKKEDRVNAVTQLLSGLGAVLNRKKINNNSPVKESEPKSAFSQYNGKSEGIDNIYEYQSKAYLADQAVIENKISKNNYSESEKIVVEKVDDIIKNICSPDIVNFFKDRFGIELGNIDLSIDQYDFRVKDQEENKNLYAAMRNSGKEANHTLIMGHELIKRVEEFKGLNAENINYVPVETISTITHELLHRMFNIDNRMDRIQGANVESEFISETSREGIVEYYSKKIAIYNLQKNTEITDEQRIKHINGINDSLVYADYVKKVEDNLKNLTIKFAFSNHPNKTMDYSKNREYIEKLLAEFFLSSDNRIIELSKELGLKSIVEI